MNINQKYVLIGVVVILLFQMILFTPLQMLSWDGKMTLYTHGNLFSPLMNSTVNIVQFILYWFIIIAIGGFVFYLAKNDKEKKKE